MSALAESAAQHLVWQWPSPAQLALFAAIGMCGVAAQTVMLRGFASGEASILVNVEYAQLLYAAVYGFVVFGDVPDHWTAAGSAIQRFASRNDSSQARTSPSAHALLEWFVGS